MVTFNHYLTDTKEQERHILITLVMQASRTMAQVMALLDEGAPDELIREAHTARLAGFVDQAMSDLSKLRESGVPSPSCN